MNENLKVSFYLKRERKEEKNGDAGYPVVGKIIIGRSIAQFSSKLKAPERLYPDSFPLFRNPQAYRKSYGFGGQECFSGHCIHAEDFAYAV
jgi:hypothetical protein